MLDFSVTFAITIVNIVILFFILKAILFRPVTKFMKDRAQKIQRDIDTAEKDRHDAKLLREGYEKKLAEAETEAEAIIKNAREYASAEAEKISASCKAEAEKIIEAAGKRAETERRAAMALFRAEAAALVVSAAGRLLKRELAGEEQFRFAREVLNELAE